MVKIGSQIARQAPILPKNFMANILHAPEPGVRQRRDEVKRWDTGHSMIDGKQDGSWRLRWHF
jgi:hypothetical protein